MEKSTQSLEEWFAKVDKLIAESDAQTEALKASINGRKIGNLLLQQESLEQVAA